tara:strand:- start:23874 stop:25388 length:1515 start_codon:yes stop_codon:yes gene_type:complete
MWVIKVTIQNCYGISKKTMKLEKGIKVILCLLVFISCSKKEEVLTLKKGTAIITGKVINLSEKTKTIRFAAGSTVKNIDQTALIDSAGNFKLEIELYHPQNVQGFFKKGFFKLFLRPTDSIHLVIDETVFVKERYPIFDIEGTSPDVDFSLALQKYLRFRGNRPFSPNAKGKTVKEFLDILQKEITKEDSVLVSFSKTMKVSDEFMDWVQKDIRYGVATRLSSYKEANDNTNGDEFDKSLFPINDDNAIVTSLYPLHLETFAGNLGISKDTVTQNLFQKKKYSNAIPRCLNTIIGNVEKGLSRDIMCYKLLLILLDLSFEDYKIATQNLDTFIANETLKSVLLEKENEHKKQTALDISFLYPQTIEEKGISGPFWKELKSKNKGKVIYVDLWATWCGPCKEEIPYATELQEYFKGKEITFVNICLDSNKSTWEKMIKKDNIKGDNYFFNAAQTGLLQNKLQLEGYPTYLIINKQGSIVNKYAPRPSSKEEIKNLLNEWIEKDIP